jgi:predicted tellurium resistance membrane protein TerC
MEILFSPDAWIALLTLTLLEIVLGIDNIVFISILSAKLPPHQQEQARFVGLAVAMVTRIALLFSLTIIMRLTAPWFTIFAQEISGRDLILITGGLFLIGKSTFEIHEKMEDGTREEHVAKVAAVSFASVIIQIGILDLVFSLDSVITAIGMTDKLPVMVAAIVIAVGFMMLAATSVSNFVDRHPTVKILALSFLILIGVALLGEGLDLHIPKGYIYFAMAFSVVVEMLNLKLRGRKIGKAA